jgi:hypothetical protein
VARGTAREGRWGIRVRPALWGGRWFVCGATTAPSVSCCRRSFAAPSLMAHSVHHQTADISTAYTNHVWLGLYNHAIFAASRCTLDPALHPVPAWQWGVCPAAPQARTSSMGLETPGLDMAHVYASQKVRIQASHGGRQNMPIWPQHQPRSPPTSNLQHVRLRPTYLKEASSRVCPVEHLPLLTITCSAGGVTACSARGMAA